MTVELIIPDLGDFEDVDVIEVLVAPGDSVEIEDALVTLETDKASIDIPATAAGEIVSVEVKVATKCPAARWLQRSRPLPVNPRLMSASRRFQQLIP